MGLSPEMTVICTYGLVGLMSIYLITDWETEIADMKNSWLKFKQFICRK